MRIFVYFLLSLSAEFVHAQDSAKPNLPDTTQHVITGRSNLPEQFKKPYVILISADGFRFDLADKYQATQLIHFRNSGIAAEYMVPVFPSLTFPNHYSIATGDYPVHDGIVDNSFYDPIRKESYSMGKKWIVEDSSWYGGTPLWVLAEKQGLLSASFYWVGAEAAIQNIRPTYYYKYSTKIAMEDRIQDVRNWLLLPDNKRPHLITFYISDVDHQEHMYGVHSKQTEEAVHFVDKAVAGLVRCLDSLNLPINYLFVSDHGMADIDTVHTLPLPKSIDTSLFIITNSLAIVHLYAKNTSDILPSYKKLKLSAVDYDVFLSTNTPSRWHYNKGGDCNRRIGDIILVAHAPKVFKLNNRSLPAATHGFDPANPLMRATFYAWGPAFKSNLKIRGFENINIYPLVAEILQLKITDPVDGDLKVLKKTLK